MDVRAFVLPALAMALLTFLVWLRLYQTRIGEMKRERIHPQSVALSGQMAKLADTRAADNFKNQFELPVLLYVAIMAAALLQMESVAFLVMAWLFVAARVAHSYIHCTYNKVMHRFKAYFVGGAILWAMWALIGWWMLAA